MVGPSIDKSGRRTIRYSQPRWRQGCARGVFSVHESFAGLADQWVLDETETYLRRHAVSDGAKSVPVSAIPKEAFNGQLVSR